MLTNNRLHASVFLMAFVIAALFGCAGRPFDYHSGNEIPEGPGVFSGEDGEVTLFSTGSGNPAAEKRPAGEEPVTADEEYREFQEFQQWKEEKAEFEEFRKWKKSREGSAEYREFQEWQRWQEFRRWQQEQQKGN